MTEAITSEAAPVTILDSTIKPEVEKEVAPAATTETAETATAQPLTMSDFLSSAPEELRNDPSFKDIKDPNELLKSFVHSQKLIGKSIRVPTEDSSEDSIKEFYDRLTSVDGVVRLPKEDDKEGLGELFNKMGRPEKSEDYKFEISEEQKKHVDADVDFQKDFFKIAHEAGLSQDQLTKVINFQIDREVLVAQDVVASFNEGKDKLQKMWGNEASTEYQSRLSAAKEATRVWSDKYPELAEVFSSPYASNNPGFVALLAHVGMSIGEDNAPHVSANTKYGMSAEDAQEKIAEIMKNAKHDVYTATGKDKEAIDNKMADLYDRAYPQNVGKRHGVE